MFSYATTDSAQAYTASSDLNLTVVRGIDTASTAVNLAGAFALRCVVSGYSVER